MNLETYIIFGVMSWLVVTISVLIFVRATVKFVRNDECRNLFMSILISLVFMIIPYTIFIMKDMGLLMSIRLETNYLIYICMFIVGIFLLKTAMDLSKFAKKYCFNCGKKMR